MLTEKETRWATIKQNHGGVGGARGCPKLLEVKKGVEALCHPEGRGNGPLGYFI